MKNILSSSLLFGYDSGARLMLEPIAEKLGLVINDALLEKGYYSALLIGTSTSEEGFTKDKQICLWARKAEIPIIGIEDYAGNASALAEVGLLDYLIVDSPYSARHHIQKGFLADRIKILPSVRYDHYRKMPVKKLTRHKFLRNILWIGQPEKDVAMAALGWIAPWCKKKGITLYFRAHPRDDAYRYGFWTNWFAKRRIRWVDCTTWKQEDLWSNSIGLAVTAFSSMALDASFHGIPVIHITHLRVVKQLLRDQKSGIRPSMGAMGAAAETYGPFSTEIMHKYISTGAIRSMDRSFGKFYRSDGPVIEKLVIILESLIADFDHHRSISN